jgi:zinc transport system ATP-binding protein
MNTNTVVKFENVTFSYDGVPALKEVSFDIEQREFTAIIGPNGGGKTTMLKLILGLLDPQQGNIRVFGGTPVSARRRVGYLPQHPLLDDDFPVTVADVVRQARLGGGLKLGPYNADDRRSANSALEAVKLAGFDNKSFSSLSIGQKQRALIARALACDPELLMLDEPAANLDPSAQNELYELLHELNKNLTVVVVSHDLGFVSKYIKKVVCVNRTAALHPASDVKGEIASMLYGDMEVRIVDHGKHSRKGEGHE